MKRMDTPKRTAKLRVVVDFYMDSYRYNKLKWATQKSYARHLEEACNTRLKDKRLLGDVRIQNIHVVHISDCYDQWLLTGTRNANLRLSCLSACWKYARQKELVLLDPFPLIDRQPEKPRKVKWERDHVKIFLDVAYSDRKYRSMGLIVHMAYEWGQRIGDMRMLTWDKLDLDAKRLDITQSKRSADVHLPISNNLTSILSLQKEEFGFQPYVAPKPDPIGGSYRPYGMHEIAPVINRIKDEANLPKRITARDLRRTAVTEMLEGGVDMAGIMQVTGHKNPQSVVPYMVNTFSGASKALSARGNDDDH